MNDLDMLDALKEVTAEDDKETLFIEVLNLRAYVNRLNRRINELEGGCNANTLLVSRSSGVDRHKFPEYLNNTINFVQLVKFMNYQDIGRFVYFVGLMADEKTSTSDQLNAFLNEMLNRGAT